MALATPRKNVITRKVERVVVDTIQEVTPDGALLSLTHNECRALAAILASIGGDPSHTARRFTDAVLHALQDAGYSWTDERGIGRDNQLTEGNVYFTGELRS